MSSAAKFLSTDTSSLRNATKAAGSKRSIRTILFIIAGTLVVAVILVVIGFFALMTIFGGSSSDKVQSVNHIESEYKSFTIPALFEYYEKNSCTAALDGCEAGVTYKYNYNKSIKESDARAMLRQDFENQGVTFDANSVGHKGDLTIAISKPTDTTIPAGKDQLQVAVELEGQHE